MSVICLWSIAELLPHTGQMILIDRLLEFSEHHVVTELTVRNPGLFPSTAQTIPAWLGIEYMAQTVGVHAGLEAKLANKSVQIGFLLGTRQYNSNCAEFRIGLNLIVKVKKIIQEDNGLGVFDCHISGPKINIQANLNTYLPPLEKLNQNFAKQGDIGSYD